MGEIIKILGVDPSLRNTGLAVVSYNTEKKVFLRPQHCRVLINPKEFTKKDAVFSMIDMVREASLLDEYQNVDNVLIEVTGTIFGKMPQITLQGLSQVSGACIALLGIHKSYIFQPIEWNRGKKKETTHAMMENIFGKCDTWHYGKQLKSERYKEHVLDAVGIAHWWITQNYIETEEISL